jgi:UDP-N-acetylmuramoylalanine--D-glutamate ligase
MDGRITILGAAESGVGAALLAKAKGYDVFVSDAGAIKPRYRAELEAAGIAYEEGGHTEERVLQAEEVIKSPGIPEKAAMVQRIRQEGIRISSEIDFASRYTQAKLVAITGTNGKTTTTLLTYHLLRTAGLDVGLAGNVGDSFARKVLEQDHEVFVLEVSSFQLDDIHTFRPNIGILLNITPDHLDRYDGMEAYAAAKFRLIERMRIGDVFIYNADDEQIAKRLNSTHLNMSTELFTGAFYQNGTLRLPLLGYVEADAKVQVSRQAVFGNLPLQGLHNGMNMSAAILAALRMGLSKAAIEEGLATFKNAPHRLEPVGQVNGVRFVNDSKATNVEAAYYALGSFDAPIVWIAGGVDKGNNYELLRPLVERHVKAIVCLGVDNAKLMAAFGETVSFIDETQSIEEAVSKAYHLADNKDIVLLSPACASFDLFRNYEDRGEQFRQAVAHLQGITF